MKFYATTTSERASKGQGGGYLDISIYDEERNKLIDIRVDNYKGIVIYESDNNFYPIAVYKKGKSQKGEKCKECVIYHNGYCDICGHIKQ